MDSKKKRSQNCTLCTLRHSELNNLQCSKCRKGKCCSFANRKCPFEGCQAVYCNDCMDEIIECSVCKTECCELDVTKCEKCNKKYCQRCTDGTTFYHCENCNENLCEECVKNGICSKHLLE